MSNKIRNNTRVNVILSEGAEPIVATVVKTFKNGKIRVADETGAEHTVPDTAVSIRKAGRKALAQVMTPDEMKADIDELLGKLEKAKNVDEKKRLRRLLRRRGHKGGLGLKSKGE